MAMKTTGWVTLGLLLGPGLGFVAGRMTAPAGQEPAPRPPPASEPPSPSAPPAAAPREPGRVLRELALLREEVRQTVREELEAFRRQQAAQAAPRERAEEAPEEAPSPEMAAAFEDANRLIDSALSARRWGEREAQELRGHLARVSAAQRAQLLARLLPAINRQELRVEVNGPPF